MTFSPAQKKYLGWFLNNPWLIGEGGENDKRTLRALERAGFIVWVQLQTSSMMVRKLTPSGHYHAVMATLSS